MPRPVTRFECTVCHANYGDEGAATDCEKRHAAVAEVLRSYREDADVVYTHPAAIEIAVPVTVFLQ